MHSATREGLIEPELTGAISKQQGHMVMAEPGRPAPLEASKVDAVGAPAGAQAGPGSLIMQAESHLSPA